MRFYAKALAEKHIKSMKQADANVQNYIFMVFLFIRKGHSPCNATSSSLHRIPALPSGHAKFGRALPFASQSSGDPLRHPFAFIVKKHAGHHLLYNAKGGCLLIGNCSAIFAPLRQLFRFDSRDATLIRSGRRFVRVRRKDLWIRADRARASASC